jgi:hypothetical protein
MYASAPGESVADPAATATAAAANRQNEDHYGRHDNGYRDPEDGSTKNTLHDGFLPFGLSANPANHFHPRVPALARIRLLSRALSSRQPNRDTCVGSLRHDRYVPSTADISGEMSLA